MSYSPPFIRLSALKDTLIIGPGVESERFRFDSPPALPLATQGLVLDGSGYFGVKVIPATVGDVTGPGSSNTNNIATFADGTGKVIKDASGITAIAGGFNGVVTINGLSMPTAQIGDVRGPPGSATNGVPVFGDITGKNLVQSSVFIVGGAVSGVTSINGDVVPSPIGNVVETGAVTDTALAVYAGTTGTVITNSTATLSPAGVLSLSAPASSGLTFVNPTGSSGSNGTLNSYAQVTVPFTWFDSGGNVLAAGQTLIAARIGNMVFLTLSFPNMVQANTGAKDNINMTAVPLFARPTSARAGLVSTFDQNAVQAYKIGYWTVNAAGSVQVYAEVTGSAAVTPWTGDTGIAGLAANNHTGLVTSSTSLSITYTLDP